ncbi:MAG: ABC transporter ATP-binding protein [Gemmatimonadota bacterium]
MLDARVVVRRGALVADVPLAVAAGEVVSLLGPNGAGKTTVLRALAGLVPLDGGHVRLGGVALEDPAAGVRVPVERRCVGLVFQDHLLFPHLSALENVAFGPRCRGVPRDEARRRATAWLERLGLAGLAGCRPSHLSGGEAQRVGLARTLAAEPSLLLLDEPLSSLDAAARPAVRSELRRHLAEYRGATIVVTHDPVEAMVLATRLIVIEGGKIVQEGSSEGVSRHPRSEWVARLVGLNLFRGRAEDDQVVVDGAEGPVVVVPAERTGGDVFVAFRPDAVALYPSPPEGSPRNVWRLVVVGLDSLGPRVRVELGGALPMAADVTPAAVAHLGLEPGKTVHAAVKATEVTVYPA